MSLQELGYSQGIVVLPMHPDRQRLDAAQQQPGRVRIHVAAERSAGGVNRVDQVSASGDDSTNQVGVSAEILGARVHDEVDAKLRGPAIDGRGEGAVDQRGDPVLLRYSRNLL